MPLAGTLNGMCELLEVVKGNAEVSEDAENERQS